MKTATFVKALDQFTGVASLYKCDPPMMIPTWDDDKPNEKTEYVVVSAAVAMFSGPETYIFPADAKGNITDWSELNGSYRGGMSHHSALAGAGYDMENC